MNREHSEHWMIDYNEQAHDALGDLPPYHRNFGKRLVKSKFGSTVTPDYLHASQKTVRFAGNEALTPWLVCGGDDAYVRSGVRIMGWQNPQKILPESLSSSMP